MRRNKHITTRNCIENYTFEVLFSLVIAHILRWANAFVGNQKYDVIFMDLLLAFQWVLCSLQMQLPSDLVDILLTGMKSHFRICSSTNSLQHCLLSLSYFFNDIFPFYSYLHCIYVL